MTIVRFDHVSVRIGTQALLDDVNLALQAGGRICLIGRNGAGKSTFLKLLEGVLQPDGGEVWRKPGLRIARLEQDLPEATEQTVFDAVAAGLAHVGECLAQYHHLAHRASSEQDLNRLAALQHEIEAQDGWRFNQKIEAVLSRLQLDADVLMSALSGGWRKRVALAKALVCDPEVLLLDEPTNHLDVEAIEWLEKQLLDFAGTIVFITHDRALLQKLATDIFELDRGQVFTWQGDYQSFLTYREERLAAEEKHAQLFDKKLAQEEVWIRQGIKARRTRNEGRVRALESMRVERSRRVEQVGKAQLKIESAQASGKVVVEATHIFHAFNGKTIIDDFSTTILRGDRVGLIGKNGSGKSTLLKILLGELQPDRGEVKQGTRCEIAYFDQLRQGIDPDKTIAENIGQGRDSITINGKTKHIISYLSDFLFTPERARTPVRALSGGEINRVFLARLFSQPANVLVMDEPTNDLDIETLELLEELLLDFDGTLLLVSHDRAFLDKVVTSSIVFEGGGVVREYVGGYSDWVRQSAQQNTNTFDVDKLNSIKSNEEKASDGKNKKMSYKLRLELEALPSKIQEVEKRIDELQSAAAAPEFYEQPSSSVNKQLEELAALQEELSLLYERWVQLDEQ